MATCAVIVLHTCQSPWTERSEPGVVVQGLETERLPDTGNLKVSFEVIKVVPKLDHNCDYPPNH